MPLCFKSNTPRHGGGVFLITECGSEIVFYGHLLVLMVHQHQTGVTIRSLAYCDDCPSPFLFFHLCILVRLALSRLEQFFRKNSGIL